MWQRILHPPHMIRATTPTVAISAMDWRACPVAGEGAAGRGFWMGWEMGGKGWILGVKNRGTFWGNFDMGAMWRDLSMSGFICPIA